MARKRKTHTKRKHHSMSAGPRKRTHTRRRRSRKGLGEMFTATTAQAAAKTIAMGAAGGILGGSVHRLLKDQTPIVRIGSGLVISFLTFAVAGFPNISSGMVGAFAALESQPMLDKMLGEAGYNQYADENALNEMPIYLNEDGEPIYLNEDVRLADEVYLSESVYPNYSVQY